MLITITLLRFIHKLFKRRASTPAPVPLAVDVVEGELLTDENDDTLPARQLSTPSSAQPRHSIGLVGFHEHGFIIARPTTPYAPWLRDRVTVLHRRLGAMRNITDGLRQAFQMLVELSPEVQRTVWLLSGGHANRELRSLFSVVNLCREARITIHTVGLGTDCDSALLNEIAVSSEQGRYHRIDHAHGLSALLTSPDQNIAVDAEATVIVVDCSHVMSQRMNQRSKMSAVEEALLDLIYYQKQHGH